MARKIIFGIFISFCSIFIMSHNTSAFDFTSSLWFRNAWKSNALYWQDDQDGTTWRNTGFKNYGTNYGDSGAVYFRLSNDLRNINIPNNSIVVITGTTYARSSTGGTSNTVGSIFAGSENLNCNIVEMEFADTYVENITTNNVITFTQTFTLVCVTTQDVSGQIAINLHLETMTQNASDYMGITFKNMYYFRQDTSIHELLEWLQNNSDDAGDTLKQEKQDVQDASDQSETDSDTAQNDASGASQSLLNATGSIVSALTSAPATDCLIDISTRQFTVGQVNLCSNVPQGVLNFVHGLIALVFTPIVLYFSYHIVITLYNLFKEYNS